jgi:hypothetical protein
MKFAQRMGVEKCFRGRGMAAMKNEAVRKMRA